MKKWTNYGDVNYLSYGGCLVRQSEQDEDVYQVFYLLTPNDIGESEYIPEEEAEDTYIAALCDVDVSDYTATEKQRMEILYPSGMEDCVSKEPFEVMSPEMWAKEIVEVMGFGNFSPIAWKVDYPNDFKDYLIRYDDLKNWLKNLGAEEFI